MKLAATALILFSAAGGLSCKDSASSASTSTTSAEPKSAVKADVLLTYYALPG